MENPIKDPVGGNLDLSIVDLELGLQPDEPIDTSIVDSFLKPSEPSPKPSPIMDFASTVFQEGLNTLSFLTSPLNVFTYPAQSVAAGGTALEGVSAALLPEYGKTPDYAKQIRHRYLPNVPTEYQPATELLIDLSTDPTVYIGIGFYKTLKKILDNPSVVIGPFQRLAIEMLTFNDVPDYLSKDTLKLAQKADAGDRRSAAFLFEELSPYEKYDIPKQRFEPEEVPDIITPAVGEIVPPRESLPGLQLHQKMFDFEQIHQEAQRIAKTTILEDINKARDRRIREVAIDEFNNNVPNNILRGVKALGGFNEENLRLLGVSESNITALKKRGVNLVNQESTVDAFQAMSSSGYDDINEFVSSLSKAPTMKQMINKVALDQTKEWQNFYDTWLAIRQLDEEERLINERLGAKDLRRKEIAELDHKEWRELIIEGEDDLSDKKLKGIIRQNTGQDPASKYLNQTIKMRDYYAGLEQGSKQAFNEGSAAGRLEALAKLKDYKLFLATKSRLNKATSKIKNTATNASMNGIWRETFTDFISPYVNVPQSKVNLMSPVRDMRNFIENAPDIYGKQQLRESFDKIEHISHRNGELSVSDFLALEDFANSYSNFERNIRTVKKGEDAISLDFISTSIANEARRSLGWTPEEKWEDTLARSNFWNAPKNIWDEVKRANASLFRIEPILNALDGFKEFGLSHQTLFKPFVEAEAKASDMMKQYVQKYKDAFQPLSKKTASYYGEIGEFTTASGKTIKVDREHAIGMALHMGSPDNIKVLERDLGTTAADINRFLDGFLTNDDRKVVENIWDMYESLWPMISDTYTQLTGEVLKRVEGKYAPIAISPKFRKGKDYEDLIAVREKETGGIDIGDIFRAHTDQDYNVSAKSKSMIERTGGAHGLDLTFDVIERHIRDSVRAVTHAVPIKDAQKLINDDRFRKAVTESLGAETYDQFKPWLRNLAGKSNKDQSTVLRHLINMTQIHTLGAKFSVALVQPLAALQAAHQIGIGKVAKGIADISIVHPTKNAIEAIKEIGTGNIREGFKRLREAPTQLMDEINSMSPEMANRKLGWDREFSEMKKTFNPRGSNLGKYYSKYMDGMFALIQKADMVGAYPTWWGAYQKGLGDFSGNTQLAREYADKVIRTTQPVMSAKDMASIQHGSQWKKALTMYYNFSSAIHNQSVQLVRKGLTNNLTVPEVASALTWLYLVPGIIENTVKDGEIPTEASDYAKILAKGTTQGFPVLRDIVSSETAGFGYKVTPLEAIPKSLATPLGRALDEEKDVRFSDFYNAAAVGIPLPEQLLTTATGLEEYYSGYTDDLSRLFFKPKKGD